MSVAAQLWHGGGGAQWSGVGEAESSWRGGGGAAAVARRPCSETNAARARVAAITASGASVAAQQYVPGLLESSSLRSRSEVRKE